MKRFTLFTTLLFTVLTLSFSSVGAKTTRSGSRAKTSTTKKKTTSSGIKTIVNKIENGAFSLQDSFEDNLAKVNRFVTSTLNPYIASRYPAKTTHSASEKAGILYDDVKKYVNNAPAYSQTSFSMGVGMNNIAVANELRTYIMISEMENRLTDEESKKTWLAYCKRLIELKDAIYLTATSYSVVVNGPGSFILAEAPAINDNLQGSLQTIIQQDLEAFNGKAICNQVTAEATLAKIMQNTDISAMDPEMNEYAPETEIMDMNKGREDIARLVPVCQQAHEKWVGTLSADIRPLMIDNLAVLLSSPVFYFE